MKKLKQEKGVTLIALVITIIVLLILAGITINLTLGEDGIIKMAQNAGKETDKAVLEENVALKKYENEIDKWLNSNIGTNNEQEPEQIPYVKDGLVLWYDGIYNTNKGHDSSAKQWENLIKETNEKYNGELLNVNYTKESGWTENSLILDGIDDWVRFANIFNENMTIEIVAKPLDLQVSNSQFYIANVQNGGIAIEKANNKNAGVVHLDEYKYIYSQEENKIGQIYSMTSAYDGKTQYFRENEKIYKNDFGKTLINSESSTVFALGTNTKGNEEALATGNERYNIEIYSVRIYNRSLTEEEMLKNYVVDTKRFNIKEITIENEKLEYIEDGLICLYDGKQNTKYGHSKRGKTWQDLTGNNNNGILQNVNNTLKSGWTENSLILDGINDWVAMTQMHYPNMTIEIVAKPLNVATDTGQFYINNLQARRIINRQFKRNR